MSHRPNEPGESAKSSFSLYTKIGQFFPWGISPRRDEVRALRFHVILCGAEAIATYRELQRHKHHQRGRVPSGRTTLFFKI